MNYPDIALMSDEDLVTAYLEALEKDEDPYWIECLDGEIVERGLEEL